MSDNSSPITAELRHDGRSLHLTLDAPKANILDARMIAAIEAALDAHCDPAQVRLVVFEGRGRHFCFGASVEEHRAEKAAAMLDAFHGLFRKLGELAVPTAAVVRGQCLGGGLELASYCSWIFAHPEAHFGQPEMRLAVFPPMASVLLPWRVGGGGALDLCVSGRSIGAPEAHRMGLVSRVDEDPAAALDAFFSENLASASPSSLRFAERAARMSLERALRTDLPALERLYLDDLMKTHDANEGLAAFLEKRSPKFGGQNPNTDNSQRNS